MGFTLRPHGASMSRLAFSVSRGNGDAVWQIRRRFRQVRSLHQSLSHSIDPPVGRRVTRLATTGATRLLERSLGGSEHHCQKYVSPWPLLLKKCWCSLPKGETLPKRWGFVGKAPLATVAVRIALPFYDFMLLGQFCWWHTARLEVGRLATWD